MPDSMSRLPADIKRISTNVFSGFSPTYYGPELPPLHMTDHHLDVSNGHEFRGFNFGPRHYFQHSRSMPTADESMSKEVMFTEDVTTDGVASEGISLEDLLESNKPE